MISCFYFTWIQLMKRHPEIKIVIDEIGCIAYLFDDDCFRLSK